MGKIETSMSKDNGAYLFVHFINDNEKKENAEQIYFSVSKDGLKWDTLNGMKPVLTSKLGDFGVRDPFIIRSPKENKFYIIATDLSIYYRKDWGEVQRSGSQCIMVWESSDLVNWSEQRMVKIGSDTAGCVWAPEAIYDREAEDFLVYWASRENFGAEKQRIYCSRTKDFITFTEPRVYIERDNHVIDTTIIEEKGKYYRFSKDETTKSIIAEVSDNLMGEFTNLDTNLKNVFGVEGPACFKMKGEDRWCLLLDHFAVEHKYFPYYTADLNSAQFTIDTKEFYIPVDAKHGGVMTISADEYDALVKAYGNKNANPVLPGLYADPGINVFGDRFYIYPTSDGFEDWSGTYFKVFSSSDLVNWTDHGVILDLPTQIPWGTSRAWAPYAATRNGKYYFYFCADCNIGVAVSDSPAGSFTDSLGKPLVAAEEIKALGGGQAIDPMVFIDDDGQAYLYFGNCNLFVAKLNDDMISLKTPLKKITPSCFREAIDVLKKDGIYYFTWSDDDTRSENYHVNYGTSTSPMGPIEGCKLMLEKDLSLGIKGTGHHSIVKVPNRDEYYIAYHRFSIPNGDGMHREVCIDKLEFNADGSIKKVKPTLEGITDPI